MQKPAAEVEAAEDVGETFVVEAGTVKGDSLCTAMLLNEVRSLARSLREPRRNQTQFIRMR